jgi:hypothetical protein
VGSAVGGFVDPAAPGLGDVNEIHAEREYDDAARYCRALEAILA